MTWYTDPSKLDGFRWRCHRMVAGTRCSGSKSIRHRSWFHGSNLTLQEVLYLMYNILCHEPANHFSDHMITDCGMFCRETLLVYLEGSSEKLGSPNKTVETDESKFSRCKYHRGHSVKGLWVFGSVERESSRTFLFLFRTEPPTHRRALFVLGSKLAPQSSVIAGLRTRISGPTVTRTAP